MGSIKTVERVVFGCLTTEEWKAFGIEITKNSMRGSDKTSGTPYDLRLGALENGVSCETCGEKNDRCPGHFGYIVLEEPCYNPEYMDDVLNILKCICIKCIKPKISIESAESQGILASKRKSRTKIYKKKCEMFNECPSCNEPLPNFAIDGYFIKMTYKDKKPAILTARQANNILSQITNETLDLLGFNQDFPLIDPEGTLKIHVHAVRPEAFIIGVLPVVPTCARPWVKGDDKKDDDITERYNSILKENNKLKNDRENPLGATKNKKKGERLKEKDRKKIIDNLFKNIWSIFQSEKDKKSSNRQQKGFYDRLSKKDGHIQSNVGGKRTNWNIRTVLVGAGPLPIPIGWVGVAESAARKISYEELITEWNIDHYQKIIDFQIALHEKQKTPKGKKEIENMPYTPLINSIVRMGETLDLQKVIAGGTKIINYHEKIKLRKHDVIRRQLSDGDWLLFNRQPTLRIESMQGQRAKILKDELVFRLSLGVTRAYNAD